MRTAGPANAVCARSAWCAIACAFGLAHIAFAKAPCFQTDEEPLVIGIIQSFLTCFVHRCTAEDASVALPRRVLGQGVSVAASRQFVWFLSLRSQGLGVGLEFTVQWVATYVVRK